jgi:hypothetical protein
MKDGPSHIGFPQHVQNLNHVGPRKPPNPIMVNLDSNSKWFKTQVIEFLI